MVFNPKLEQKALVILSNNDGCIIARSPKAKAMGIQMGDPAYLYKHLKEVIMLSSNFALYSDMSQRVVQTLSTLVPELEVYSIDEVFFEIEGGDLKKRAFEMRQRVKQWTGIPVSIGIAPTKTLAKLASERSKKGTGVELIQPEEIDERLKATPLEEIWGIGASLTERLKKKGIYTAEQLARADDTWIQKLLGVTGFRTVLELRGIPCFSIDEIPAKKKSIVSSRSFGQKIKELSHLYEAIATFVSTAAEKMRSQESLASFISVFLSTSHETLSSHIQLPNPTSYTPELITLAKEGVSRIYRPGAEYRKGGVMLGDFTEGGQSDFITPPGRDRSKAMKLIDEINARYDKPMVRFAATGTERPWQSKREHASSKFTTQWSDLLKVD